MIRDIKSKLTLLMVIGALAGCQSVPVPVVPAKSVLITWQEPKHYTTGEPLPVGEISHYVIYRDAESVCEVQPAGFLSYEMMLMPGEFVGVQAVTINGGVSEVSNYGW